jgi:hypothetical protein
MALKQAIAVYSIAPSQNLSGGTEETHENIKIVRVLAKIRNGHLEKRHRLSQLASFVDG